MNLAYTDALGTALIVAAAVALLGAVLAWMLVADHAKAREESAVLEASAMSAAADHASAAGREGEPQPARA
jgi:hypothetical protein